MSVEIIPTLILIGGFLILVLLRVHVAFAMLISSGFTAYYLGLPLSNIFRNMIQGVSVYTFLAVPFFVLLGQIMKDGDIADKLIDLANSIVGWMRGGLAMVNILASMFFGGISGSSVGDTASIGAIMIPMMKKEGYDGDFAATVTMASSAQGLLVPPSHNFVIYSTVAGGVSISALFLAGILPGVFLGIALMIFSYIVSRKRDYPVHDQFKFKVFLKSLYRSFWGLFTVVIVVVGVTAGVFTATESASIAVMYAIIVTLLVYRSLNFKKLFSVFEGTIKTMAIVMILVASANVFGWLIAYLQIPGLLAEVLLSTIESRVILLLGTNILFLFLGTMMGMSAIIVILTPILLPIMIQMGVDPVHFGVFMILNLGIGLITPPVGATLFVGSALSGIRIESLAKSMLPFYLVMIFVLLTITLVPDIVMFIPEMLGAI